MFEANRHFTIQPVNLSPTLTRAMGLLSKALFSLLEYSLTTIEIDLFEQKFLAEAHWHDYALSATQIRRGSDD